jgi:Serine hydrolase (FSH1)
MKQISFVSVWVQTHAIDCNKNHHRRARIMTTLLRVLCLHDEQSNAAQLATQWSRLEEKLAERHGVELVFCNGPIIILPPAEAWPGGGGGGTTSDESYYRPPAADQDGEEEAMSIPRAWWTREHQGVKDTDTSGATLVLTDGDSIRTAVTGLDASLMLLRQIWTSSPFIGIVGVGQGASMASLLTASVLEPPPHFLVLVNGASLFPDEEQLSTIPTLHLVDDEDNDDDKDQIHQKKLLRQQFPGIVARRTGHGRDDCNVIGRFICDQTNALFQSDDSLQQVSLQLALYEVECQAEDAIARHIADHPPSSLMAVIRPNMVALPNRRHETPLAGAPCPSEFLVARERRRDNNHNTDSNDNK